MKIRTDFVSNSSSSCYMVPISKNHDRSKWHKNTLRPYPDNKKLQMKFGCFSHSETFTELEDNWAFLCCQLVCWSCYDAIDGTTKTKKKILRDLYNSDGFIKVQDAVIEYLGELGIECKGIELDSEEILNNDGYRILRPECEINHGSIFDGLEDMMKQAHCSSVAELIWGIKEIKIVY